MEITGRLVELTIRAHDRHVGKSKIVVVLCPSVMIVTGPRGRTTTPWPRISVIRYSILHRAEASVTDFLKTIGVGLRWIVGTSITATRDNDSREKANKVLGGRMLARH